MARRKLSTTHDVIRDVLKTQTTDEIEITFEKERNKLTIKGDRVYVLIPYKKLMILFADGDVVRDNIKHSKDLSSDIDSVLYWSGLEYERCKDLKTGDVVYAVRRVKSEE